MGRVGGNRIGGLARCEGSTGATILTAADVLRRPEPPRTPFRGVSRRALIGIGAALALVGAIVAFLVLFDWNLLRGPIGRYASARLGREVAITGDLRVHPWSFSPRVEANGVLVGQPAWAKALDPDTAPMARIGRVALRIKLPPLLRGRTILPYLIVDQPDVRLLRAKDGQANWTFGATKRGQTPVKLPAIQRFVINDGRLRVDDRQRRVLFVGSVSAQERAGEHGGRFVLEGRGRLNDAVFLAEVKGGPLLNITPDHPYPFDADIRAGSTRVLAQGDITKPFDLGRFDARLSLSGADLNRLHDLTGLTLPNTPPYQLSGRLTRAGNRYAFEKLTGRVGDSDIAGDLVVLTGGERPYLEATLRSRRLDFDDLGSLVGAAPATGRGETASAGQRIEAARRDAIRRLLPDATLQVDRVRAMDAKVSYRAETVNAPNLPLRKVSLEVNLNKGVLTLDPIAFTFSRGDLKGRARLDARPAVPRTDLDVRLTNARLEDFIPIMSDGRPVIEGPVMARVRLSGEGNSVHRAAAAADGSITLVAPRGQIRQAFAELLGVNASKGLILLLSKSDKQTPVRCAVADFDVRNGVMTADHLVADTGVVLARGRGTLNLGTETMDLRIEGDSKKPRLVRLFVPITIRGPFMAPRVGLEPGKAVGQGGAAAALGSLVNPLAALLPFVTTGEAKDADCAGLVDDARRQGAPVKASR